MGTIRQIIQQLLQKRQAQVPEVTQRHRALAGLISSLDDLEKLASDVAKSQIASGDLKGHVASLTENIRNFRARTADLHAKLASLIARFAKNTINIGVAGKARQEKSTLLQAISGLDNSVIPANDGLACTGAKNRIIHHENDSHALIEFYSQEEFLSEIVQAYFADLGLTPFPRSLDDFRRPLPEMPPGLPGKHGVFEKLQKLHTRFGQFSNLLSRKLGRASLEHVHEFVSQEEGRARYLAVKCANIHVRFPNRDVTGIGLIDLPGLGEIAKGHSQKLVSSLQHEVDAVVLVKMPDKQGDFWDKIDYEVFDCIKVAVPEIELKDWLFVLLNENEDSQNLKQVELLKNNAPEVGSRLTILSANCRSAEHVDQRVFTFVLQHLINALPRIDRHYVASLARQFAATAGELETALRLAKDFFQRGPGVDEFKFSDLCEKFTNEVKQSLETLVAKLRPSPDARTIWDKLRGKKQSGASDKDFQTAIKDTCETLKLAPPVPSIDYLREQFYAKGGWPAVVQQELHHLRSFLTHELAKKLDSLLDQIVDGVLADLLNGLLAAPLNRLLPVVSTDFANPRHRIRAFRELLNEGRQPSLVSAMDYALSFSFSYQSHFHYRVRMAMDPLDPLSRGGNIALAGKHAKHAEEIAEELKIRYMNVVTRVYEEFQGELQNDPFKAIFAMAEEIRDRLVRAKGAQREWQSFLFPRRGEIWPDVFGQAEAETARCIEWQDSLEKSLQAVDETRSAFSRLA